AGDATALAAVFTHYRERLKRMIHLRLDRRLAGYKFGMLGSFPTAQRDERASGLESWSGNPQLGLVQDESMARLHQELDRLGGLAPVMWDLLARGMRLHEIAAALDLSYEAAKRRRRKLIAHLRTCLAKE